MVYSPELYYLSDPNFPLQKAVLVTALKVSEWCQSYQATLLSAKKGVTETTKAGLLPEDYEQKQVFMNDLIQWIFDNSEVLDIFALFLDDKPSIERKNVAKFDHHDDTSCWGLRLSETEFHLLQEAWKEHDLPDDLFYPESAGHQEGHSYYTPKQWALKQAT